MIGGVLSSFDYHTIPYHIGGCQCSEVVRVAILSSAYTVFSVFASLRKSSLHFVCCTDFFLVDLKSSYAAEGIRALRWGQCRDFILSDSLYYCVFTYRQVCLVCSYCCCTTAMVTVSLKRSDLCFVIVASSQFID